MASLRNPLLRHLTSSPLRAPRILQQRRWAQVHDVRFLTTQSPQAILEKYQSKLAAKAKNEGHSNIDDLKTAYADKIAEQRKKDAIDEALKIPEFTNPSPPPPPPTPESSTSAAPRQPQPVPRVGDKKPIKSLDDIIDLDKVRTLPEKELTAIWRLRHANSPQNLCAVIPASTYKTMEDIARRAPQFVLPVPHETQGAEIHFLQWTFDRASKTSTVLFTQLAEYKSKGEFATPHTTVTHHLDLADEKGLVLMQGQVMDDRGVKAEHAKWLLMCLQRFYGGWDDGMPLEGERKVRADARLELLDWFAKGDERFSVDKLMEEAERMG